MSSETRDGVVSLVALAAVFAWILFIASSDLMARSPWLGGILAVGGGLLLLMAGGLVIMHGAKK
ncbi:membrane protein [Arthrobacter phage MaGuCo]|uniref:Membrane protein n=1 Tax=Arthrobacter phage MaGuCo TaxID=3038363 RepID=A0AAF0GFC4_9CAUD|nr:membrane protein [Arthrobacter phage MaGuCo]